MYTKEIKKLIAEFCEQEKYRLPNFIPVGMGLGVSFYFLLDYEPNFYLNIRPVAKVEHVYGYD